MSTPAYRLVETLSRVAPFGLGLWDVVARRLVSDGLIVHVFAHAGGRFVPRAPAIPNRSGVFVPHDLLGAAAFDESPRGAASPPEEFVLDVRDTLERYASFVMRVGLADARGFVLPPCIAALELPAAGESSPAPQPAYVPLFATPANPLPAGMAVVRASLVDAHTRRPAEFAVLEVRESGRLLALGVADARGEASAVFPYPEISAPPPWSPPGAAPKSVGLADHRWPLEVAVKYRRDLPRYRTDPLQPALPDLCDVLQQPAVPAVAGSPSVHVSGVELAYGEDLAVGELLIGPA